eukprot:CAMPEP_0197583056 /NCGR_PEP_ID=MMETSP1326-20131121/6090_1 /TAXON_ID=1155430 /ORGANISM="Genus nov. species nov., Strain RCC2288" /LENGTH=398 /DNA_ID=CAMNT_0043147225 /DNA_START=182 /DNA_END=1375 /DNA_ORIENTATION=+
MSDIGAMIAAKARAAAQKVSEMNGLPTRVSATYQDKFAPMHQSMLALGPGDGTGSMLALPDGSSAGGGYGGNVYDNSGALVAVDPNARGDADIRRMMPNSHFHQRVNGALVVVRPDQKEALSFAQYRENLLRKNKRENTKWGPVLADDPEPLRGRTLAYKMRIDQLTAKMEATEVVLPPVAERSPSPPPHYDPATSLRTNTRDQRMWDKWDAERREVVQETLKCDPLYKPPHGHRALVKEVRLYIPAKENPGYNFIGLIIGPRGNTQKRLEGETGAKIVIRGKGSEKEGSRPARNMDGMDDDLHVHISADTLEKVDRAARLVHPLLTPLDSEHNVHKIRQLRELAEINGTIKDVSKLQERMIADEQNATMYKLSGEIQTKVDTMYQRDVARLERDRAA